SSYAQGEKDGRKSGYEDGYERGRMDGEDVGYRKGMDEGKRLGMGAKREDLFRKYKSNYAKMDEEAVVLLMNYMNEFKEDHAGLISHLEDSILHSPSVLNELVESFRAGYQYCFDSIHHITLMPGQAIQLRGTDYEIKLNYDEIAKVLHSFHGSENASYDSYAFASQVKAVHLQVMTYLVERLNLTPYEVERMKSEYFRIHDYTSELYFKRYRAITEKIYQHQQKPFYDYAYYRSVEVFMDIINSGLCSVMDVVLTYAKFNSQYAAVVGMEGMGHLCQLLQDEVMFKMEENLIRNSLIFDYDSHRPLLRTHTISIIRPIKVATFIEEKEITREIDLDDGASASVDMTINSMVNLGMDLQEAEVEVNHDCQYIMIHLPEQPYKIDMAHQWYTLNDMEVKFEYEKKVWTTNEYHITEGRSYSETRKDIEWADEKVKIPGEELEFLFELHKPELADIIDLPPLDDQVLEIVTPILRKIYEQPVALESSCYNVYVRFRGKVRPLIEFECHPGCDWGY
ncbi:MAG: hypothetical protein AAFU33_26370, partial [Bacteroidota bacterium]